jgi:hypothetical protein
VGLYLFRIFDIQLMYFLLGLTLLSRDDLRL